MPPDPTTTVTYAVAALLALLAFVLVAWWMRLWTTFRKWDRRQRVKPRVTAATLLLVGLGLAPIAYYEPETTWPLVVAGVAYFLGLQLLGVFASNYDWYRAYRRVPRKDARTVGYEPVQLSGTVAVPEDEVGADTIPAPVSETPCVAYLASASERRPLLGAGRGRGATATLALDRGSTPFYLEDDTGRILVDPSEADVLTSPPTTPATDPNHAASFTVDPGDSAPDHLQAYERELGIEAGGRRRRTYRERRIEPGDEVYVVGRAKGVTGTEYPARATRVVTNGEDVGANVVVQAAFDRVEAAFENVDRYYRYGGAAATVGGFVGMVALSVL